MRMYPTLSRVLGGVALAASLATMGVAEAAAPGDPRPLETRTADTPAWRMVEPDDADGDAPPSIAPNPRRQIFSEVVYSRGRLYLRGDVENYFGREVKVQRRLCDACRWRRFDVTRTGKRGWFRAVINAPRSGSTYWRAKVAPSDGYSRSFSATWETHF